jgi:predicted NBD/HSP70 family sugar kinase
MPRLSEQWLRDVLGTLYQRRTMTRAQIVQATELNSASVSHSLQHLSSRGIILKVGELQSRAGRRRDVLTLNADANYFVAIDLQGTRIRFALTNFVGDIRYRWEEDIEFGTTLETAKITHGIRQVLRSLTPAQLSRLVAIGISSPGVIERSGAITAYNLNWHKFPLMSELRKSIDTPIFLEPANVTCILAERWLGRAQNVRNCMYVRAGHGIGVGIYSNGQFVGGRDQMAGQLGHMTIEPAAQDLCHCGRRGCLQAIASSPSVVRQYLEKTGRPHDNPAGYRIAEVFERARQGDPAANEVLDRAGRVLGLGLSYLVSLFNPELIILGGEFVNGEDVLLPRIKEQLARHTMPALCEDLEIAISTLGLDIGLKGAASLAFRNSLDDSALLKKMLQPVVEMHAEVEAQVIGS